MAVPLETAASATFDDNGRAVVSIGPDRATISWQIKRMYTSTQSIETKQPTLRIYRNVETPSAQIASTYAANADENETDVRIRSGERLLCIWEGGTPGKEATIVISGDIINAIR